jgi:hypothetical protein
VDTTTEEGLQTHEEVPVPTPSSIKSKMDDDATDIQPAQEPEASLTEPDVPTASADQEPVITPEAPPVEVPHLVETQSDADVTTLPFEDTERYSLVDAWAWADRAEREAFVAQHHSELKKIVAKIERKKAAAS